MPTNQFAYFANGIGANVEDITTYLSDTTTSSGFTTGEALSANCNRVWSQSSMASNLIGYLITEILQVDAIDEGNLTHHLPNITSVMQVIGYANDNSTTVNVMNATLPIAPLSYFNGMSISLVPNITNTTSVTLNLNGLGTKAVITNNGPLRGGELIAGSPFQIVYLTALDKWVLLNYQTTCVTQAFGDNSNKLASTSFVASNFAPINSPSLSGTPNTTVPPVGDNSTRIATTSWVKANVPPAFPSGTRLVFAMSSAPSGWVQDITDTATNRILRVVSDGSGNTVGGSNNPISMGVADLPSHTHTFTTGVESAPHTHIDAGHTHQYDWRGNYLPQSGSATYCWNGDSTQTTTSGKANLGNETAQHTHSGTTDPTGTGANWTPRYVNMIICTKT